jgi:membrane protease YdiL (CAAX protease family)
LNNNVVSMSFEKFSYRDAIGVFLAFVILLPLISLLIRYFSEMVWVDSLHEIPNDNNYILDVLGLIISDITVGILVLIFVRFGIKNSSLRKVLCFSGVSATSFRSILLSFGLGFLIVLVQGGIFFQLFPPTAGLGKDSLIMLSRQSVFEVWMALLVAVVIVAPLVEEFLFRGLIFVGMRNSFGNLYGGIISSTLFLLAHFQVFLKGYWVSIMALTAMSFMSGVLRVKYNSLVPAMFGHAGYNFAALVFSRF